MFVLDGTNILTKQGRVIINEVCGNSINVWCNDNWTEVKVSEVGVINEYYNISLGDGSYINLTKDSTISIKNRFNKSFKRVIISDLYKNFHTYKYTMSIPRSNVKLSEGVEEKLSYDYGFILGDGFIPRNRVEGALYNEDKKLKFVSSCHIGNYKNYRNKDFEHVYFNVDVEFAKKLKYSNGLPNEVFRWNRSSILNFIAGWADADGTNASKGIRIYGRKDKIKDGQLLLSSIGIYSSFNLMSKKGAKTNLGERKNDVWYLQITKTDEIPSQRLKCDNSQEGLNKGKLQTIRAVTLIKEPIKCYSFDKSLEKVFLENILLG